jgi:hypothetical protein
MDALVKQINFALSQNRTWSSHYTDFVSTIDMMVVINRTWTNMMWMCEFDSTYLNWCPVNSSCEYGNKLSDSIKDEEYTA